MAENSFARQGEITAAKIRRRSAANVNVLSALSGADLCVCRPTLRTVGRCIANREESLSATQTTPLGKTGEDCCNCGETDHSREQVTTLANCPACDRQADEHGGEKEEKLPSRRFGCGGIAHGGQSGLTLNEEPCPLRRFRWASAHSVLARRERPGLQAERE